MICDKSENFKTINQRNNLSLSFMNASKGGIPYINSNDTAKGFTIKILGKELQFSVISSHISPVLSSLPLIKPLLNLINSELIMIPYEIANDSLKKKKYKTGKGGCHINTYVSQNKQLIYL